MFKRFRKNEKGQGMVEYGLILALVSIISITALGGIGGNIKDKFDKVVLGIGGSVVEDGAYTAYTEEEIQNLIKQGYIPIATADELNQLRNNTVQAFGGREYTSGLDKKYIQVANIDLGGIDNFEPIGKTDTANSFTGIYDGGGYTISNLKINRGSNDYAGLFGRTDGSAELKNIGLVNVDVIGGDRVGGLVGYQFGSTITNSYASGSVSGLNQVGGLVGYQNGGSITNSYASGSVSGTGNYVGGLVGFQYGGGTITNSYASGSVSGTGQYVGGLVGYQNGGSITNSYTSGSVSGGSHVGGLVGRQNSGSITNSYWDKDNTGQTTSDGTGATFGKTTAEMKTQETFSDWDFDKIWQIKSGEYPTLR